MIIFIIIIVIILIVVGSLANKQQPLKPIIIIESDIVPPSTIEEGDIVPPFATFDEDCERDEWSTSTSITTDDTDSFPSFSLDSDECLNKKKRARFGSVEWQTTTNTI